MYIHMYIYTAVHIEPFERVSVVGLKKETRNIFGQDGRVGYICICI